MKAPERKLYLGPRLRVLRRELGVSQTRMAEELGVSPSYLNHLERNQRPLSAQMLLRLASTYDIDVRDFVSGSGEASAGNLGEILADALVRDIAIPRHEVMEVAENYPGVVEAIGRFYQALVDFRRMPDMLQQVGDSAAPVGSPLEWLREQIQKRRNHWVEIDAAAEAIGAPLSDDPTELYTALRLRLAEKFNVSVRIVSEDMLPDVVRHYDFHRRRLMLSQRLPASGRLFALAYQLALLELAEPLSAAVERAAPPDKEARALLRVSLANYAAAAIVMPYERFLAAAEESRYDLPLLEARFGASFEQVAHRLTTLNRQGARGVSFFMVKVDEAGNVSKRFAGDNFPFARFGGACPRWNIHQTFRAAGQILTQMVETPDGVRYFTLSRAMARQHEMAAQSLVAIGLGCELKHAERIGMANAAALARQAPMTIGPACHLCERRGCPDRALPPISRSLEMNQFQRSATPYPFRGG